MVSSAFSQDLPGDVFQKAIIVTDEQVDCFGRMTPTAMLQQMQDAAGERLSQLGLDCDTVEDRGYLWMLVRTSLRIFRLPRPGDHVLVRTWFGPEKRWMYPGHYVLCTFSGAKIAEAASQWMLVDKETRKLADPPEWLHALPETSLEGEPELPARKMPFPPELPKRVQRTVQPHEIDRNGHMNNSHYLQWAVEIPDLIFRKNNVPGSVWIEYSHELLADQTAELKYAHEEDALYLRGLIESEDAFKMKIVYRPFE